MNTDLKENYITTERTLRGRIGYYKITLLLILFFAGVLRYNGMMFSYPFIAHPDEPHYTFTAAGSIQQEYRRPEMKGYPPGIIYINSICLALFYRTKGNPTSIIPFVRFLAITFSLGTIFLMMITCRMAGFTLGGVIAGLLWACTPILVEYDRYGVPEPFQAFFTMLTFYYLIRALYLKDRRAVYYAYTAACAAVLFKYPACLLLLPVAGVDIFIYLKERSFSAKQIISDKPFLIKSGLLAIFFVWLLFIYGAYPSGASPSWSWRRHTVFQGLNTAYLFRFFENLKSMLLTINKPSGKVGSTIHHFKIGSSEILLPLAILLYAVPGIIYQIVYGTKKVMLLFCIIFPVVFIGILSLFNPAYRHFIPVFPFYFILIGIGLSSTSFIIYRYIKQKKKNNTAIFLTALCPVLIIILSIEKLFIPSIENMRYRMKYDIRNSIREWMNSSGLPPGRFASTAELQSLFLRWSGFSGKSMYFRIFTLLHNYDPPLPDNYMLKNHIRYLIIPVEMLKRWSIEYPDKLQDFVLIREFQAGPDTIPNSYVLLGYMPKTRKEP